jgi:type I restriction enzyme M protein
MAAIERDNPRLKGVLPKHSALTGPNIQRLREMIDVKSANELTAAGEGERIHFSVHPLGRVSEYFLTRIANALELYARIDWTEDNDQCSRRSFLATNA